MSRLASFSRWVKERISVDARKNDETTSHPVSVPSVIPNHFNKETLGHHVETRLEDAIFCFIGPFFCVDRTEVHEDSM